LWPKLILGWRTFDPLPEQIATRTDTLIDTLREPPPGAAP
jgi:hypothetical protein